jgi:hypothetical protein
VGVLSRGADADTLEITIINLKKQQGVLMTTRFPSRASALATLLAVSLCVLHVASPTDAAQRRGRGRGVMNVGYATGYASGFEAGRDDRQSRDRFNYRDHGTYEDADRGYKDEYGPKSAYQRSFRSGYQAGYSDGYYGRQRNNQYSSYTDPYYSRDPGYSVPAGYLDTRDLRQRAQYYGYRDGHSRGEYDRRIGARQPKPEGHGAYQTAANGWVESLGSQGEYQQIYREYFIAGYQDGFGRRPVNRRFRRY